MKPYCHLCKWLSSPFSCKAHCIAFSATFQPRWENRSVVWIDLSVIIGVIVVIGVSVVIAEQRSTLILVSSFGSVQSDPESRHYDIFIISSLSSSASLDVFDCLQRSFSHTWLDLTLKAWHFLLQSSSHEKKPFVTVDQLQCLIRDSFGDAELGLS